MAFYKGTTLIAGANGASACSALAAAADISSMIETMMGRIEEIKRLEDRYNGCPDALDMAAGMKFKDSTLAYLKQGISCAAVPFDCRIYSAYQNVSIDGSGAVYVKADYPVTGLSCYTDVPAGSSVKTSVVEGGEDHHYHYYVVPYRYGVRQDVPEDDEEQSQSIIAKVRLADVFTGNDTVLSNVVEPAETSAWFRGWPVPWADVPQVSWTKYDMSEPEQWTENLSGWNCHWTWKQTGDTTFHGYAYSKSQFAFSLKMKKNSIIRLYSGEPDYNTNPPEWYPEIDRSKDWCNVSYSITPEPDPTPYDTTNMTKFYSTKRVIVGENQYLNVCVTFRRYGVPIQWNAGTPAPEDQIKAKLKLTQHRTPDQIMREISIQVTPFVPYEMAE